MLPKVTRLDHYIRGRTWLSPTFARDEIEKRGAGLENCMFYSSFGQKRIETHILTALSVSFTPEEIEEFKKDHQTYQKFRKGKRVTPFCQTLR